MSGVPFDLTDMTEAALAVGVCAALDTWQFGTWKPDAEYEPADVRPIYLGPDDPASAPDERVIVTPRAAMPVRGRIVLTGIGFNYRGPVDGDELLGLNFTSSLYQRLHRLAHFTFGTVRVGAVLFGSAGSIGRDANRRPGATANYLFRGILPTENT